MSDKKHKSLIIFISIFLPVAVAALFGIRIPNVEPLSFLPPIYATINGITALSLIVAVMAIKNGKRGLHERLMMINLILSILFLLMYIAYHMTSDPTLFGDIDHNGSLNDDETMNVGNLRYLYYVVLASHIILSVAIIPLVLITYVKTLSQQFDKHKKIAKIAFPLWLYVAVTGVIVYWMISPYYG